MIEVQMQDSSGNWRTINTLFVTAPAAITSSMNEVARNYPGSRVRAIDENGRIVDML